MMMRRIGTVRPELFISKRLFIAEQKCRLPLRLTFIALFTCCNDAGCFRWVPRQLKRRILPNDNVDFRHILDILLVCGFIQKHVHKGKTYGHLCYWYIEDRNAPTK